MALLDKVKSWFNGNQNYDGGCFDEDNQLEAGCSPELFDDYTEVDSTKVDSAEGAPR